MSSAITTTDHATIKSWCEKRGGRPARVKSTGGGPRRKEGAGGILRIDFREPDDSLEQIEWEEFFDTFEKNKLAFLYQDSLESGEVSRFFKFVARD